MQCEICGSEGKLRKVRIDEAELNVCEKCMKFGTPVALPVKIFKRESSTPRGFELEDVVEDFGKIIKRERERKGWTQTVLAHKVQERESLIRKIERSEIFPEESIRKKLENTLGVVLKENEK